MLRLFTKINRLERMLLGLYSIIVLCLFLYTFTQIDLSLTFSRIEFLKNIFNSFQHIGYFDRPLSTYLYIGILLSLFIFYGICLNLAKKKKITKPFVWMTVIISTVILVFSYNAFSYDLFNYIFDAKIVTHYHANPYEHKALDYPGDPMLSFMRWTHRVYPYGPVWLGLTIPLSFFGLQIFLLTFFFFKAFIAASFVLCVYAIGKIFQKIAPERELSGLVFFALNPLILIEGLVSAHIDLVMMCFSLWALYLMIRKKYFTSYISLAISIGIKFVTGFILPIFIVLHYLQAKQKHINWNVLFGACLVLMTAGVIVESSQSNFQPWYILALLPYAVFLAHKYFILIPSIIISFAALLNYVPYLYTGNWDKPIPQILSDINFFSYCLSIIIIALYFGYNQIILAKKAKKLKR